MQAQGIVQITDELTLNNPVLSIAGVDYNWQTDDVNVRFHFTEGIDGIFIHERTFSFKNTTGGQLTATDILNWMSTHPVLSQFK
jgi:hypothetical protein